MIKFGRNYKAVFTIGHRNSENTDEMIDDETITVQYPFTAKFSIDTGIYSTSNSGQFEFFNLNAQDRAKLWLDLFETGKKYVRMEFYAGYGSRIPKIFEGYFLECTSQKSEGSTEWVTSIKAFNAGDFLKYGFMNATFTAGTKLEDILRLATEGSDVKLGYITPDIPPLPLNKTFIGKTMDLITREWSGYNIWIDNGEINVLGENEVIEGEVDVITDESGLLGSPRRANLFLELDMLFSPNYRAGQAVSVLSRSMPQFNRAYQISKVQHQGIISPTVAGKLTTTLIMSMFAANLDKVKKVEHAKSTVHATPAVKNINWQRPVDSGKITSDYGYRNHPILKNKDGTPQKKFHDGIDIAVPVKTPVYAAADGYIAVPPFWNDGYGKYIEIQHKDNNGNLIISFYAHLSEWQVNKGDRVVKGQQIALSGNTAGDKQGKKMTTGPHLHFGMHINTQSVNPRRYINF